ncbi:Dolichyl-diphosphooligosaccharide--protein glycosyltransferase subunit dad-1 [Cytospora mali]|uniref:Dolichyl-diphosphooligosaccharide--protein glycosyltransferase subunit OST2 n=1 Tax=Cytospora mali TaxID=578113 RepID=A0A194VBL7_CYTMA|nr:Dolichyl-diphosphooligosaccharide--protein glycosyltransferase subunit dad-1 [Valsa mali var. pyri (nom. inval.)]
MAPKKNAATAPGSAAAEIPSTPQVKSTKAAKSTSSSPAQLVQVGEKVWNHYLKTTGHQTRIIDAFLVFLMVVGVIQFVYYILIAKDPFNAFLAGFAATVGQFVLTVSLRMQTDAQNKTDFPKITPERSFADYIFGSLILHFFCVNYIN